MTDGGLVIYVNGAFVPEADAKISVFDRSFFYGDGIFEGIAVWKRTPFRLDAHLERMAAGLQALRIENPLTAAEWRRAIVETIRLNDLADGYLRPQVSRGEGISSIRWQPHLLRKPTPNVVIVPVRGFREYYAKLFAEKTATGLTAKLLSRPRVPSRSIPPNIKHCNYLNSVLGAIEVTSAGVDVGLAIDDEGYLTEGLGYNVFVVRGGTVMTPPLTRDLLPGITRAVILEVARRDGLAAVEADVDVPALLGADEVFVCSTLELGAPVIEIDGTKIGDGKPGPLTKRIGGLLLHEMDREAERFTG